MVGKAKGEHGTGKNARARGASPVFPLRAAAVDVGSNAVRLLVAEFSSPQNYTVIRADRSAIRLGHGVFVSGHLSTRVMTDAVGVMAEYASHMRELGVTRHRAVATSAVRESSNGKGFLARVRRASGLELEVISGSEEARLVCRAVASRLDLGRGVWMMADLGGGSVEVSLADGTGVLWSESHTMGSVRLLEELAGASAEPGGFLRLLQEYAETLRIPGGLLDQSPAGFIATGGNMETLAQMAAAAPGPDGVARLPVSTLSRLIRQLARLSYRERVAELGLREDRADVILPAAIVYERLARLSGLKEITVPFVGVREGIVLDLADRLASGLPPAGAREQQVHQACLALGRKYRFDEAHGIHVARLALELFDQLRQVHQLGEGDRAILQAAALLHDIGSFVSYNRHHKHSLYLIQQADLPGFAPAEIQRAANVARYHRRSLPKLEHEAYAALDLRGRAAVSKLAALLRLADALDREHRQKVSSLRANVSRGTLSLTLGGEGDLLLEGWALKRKADLLKKTYGLSAEVSSGGRRRGGKR